MKKILYLLFVISSLESFGSHLKGGTIECSIISNTTIQIKLRLLRDYHGIEAGHGLLSLGDGTEVDLASPTSGATINTYALIEAEIVEFTLLHTYVEYETYKIGYKEAFRNFGVLNIGDSGSQNFYVQTTITMAPTIGLNNTPTLHNIGYGNVLFGSEYYTNFGALDADGDSLSYSMDFVRSDNNIVVPGYKFPNNILFYQSDDTRIRKFNIDPITGNLQWTVPEFEGEYNAAITIHEWRKIDGIPKKLSSTNFDFQLNVINDIFDEYPQLTFPISACYDVSLSEIVSVSQIANDKVYNASFLSSSDNTYLNGELLSDFQFNNIYSNGTLEFSLEHEFEENSYGFITMILNLKSDLVSPTNPFQIAKSFYFGFGCDQISPVLTIKEQPKMVTTCYQSNSMIEFKRSDNYSGPAYIVTFDISGKPIQRIKTTFINGISSIEKPMTSSQLVVIRLQTINDNESLKLILE